jgi:hypothetical protein
MAALSTIALVAGAAAAVGGTTYSVVQGERSAKLQRYARRDQASANQQALAAAASEQRRAAEAERAANRRAPDIAGLLLGEADVGKLGTASTMLTGPRGLGDLRPKLPKPSLLGD